MPKANEKSHQSNLSIPLYFAVLMICSSAQSLEAECQYRECLVQIPLHLMTDSTAINTTSSEHKTEKSFHYRGSDSSTLFYDFSRVRLQEQAKQRKRKKHDCDGEQRDFPSAKQFVAKHANYIKNTHKQHARKK